MTMKKIKHLVVDSGAFIKNSPVHEYSECVYTVDGAIKEIKDKATRQRLQFLPYKLIIKEPHPEIYKYVLEFSKKTGDYASLSVVDLQIIALTYQLEKENVGIDHLNKEPSCKVTTNPAKIDANLVGFYNPKQKVSKDPSNSEEKGVEETSKIATLNGEEDNFQLAPSEIISDDEYETASSSSEESVDDNDCVEEDGDDEEEDDDDSWITPSNIAEVQAKMGSLQLESTTSEVACVTTDFAVQNVLLQIGLNVVSVDGMLIKQAKVFILRCYACYRTTNDIAKKFCPNCGNKTLKRVAVTVNEDGTKKIHINFKKPINIRGKRFSLPMPKGGKHAFNPVVCEDQPIPENKLSKAFLKKTNVLQDDYEVQKSPFAFNDVYSRSVNLGIHVKHNFDKKNPNVNPKRTGNKKRR